MTLPPTRRMRIEIQQGDDHPVRVPVYGEDGAAIDVTGWTARSQVRDYAGALLHEWDTAAGSIECGPEGVLLLTDDSTDWEWERGLFDVVAVAPDGTQVVPGAGSIAMRLLVTR